MDLDIVYLRRKVHLARISMRPANLQERSGQFASAPRDKEDTRFLRLNRKSSRAVCYSLYMDHKLFLKNVKGTLDIIYL